MTRDTQTCCRTFGIGAFTTYFYDLCLSRLGFKQKPSACEVNALANCAIRRGPLTKEKYSLLQFKPMELLFTMELW